MIGVMNLMIRVLGAGIVAVLLSAGSAWAQSCDSLIAERDAALGGLLAAQSSLPSNVEVLQLEREVSDTVSALELARRTLETAIPNFNNEVIAFDELVISFVESDQAEEILKAQIDESVETLRSAAYQLIEIRRAEAAVRTMNDQLVGRVKDYNATVLAYNEKASTFQSLQDRLQSDCGIEPVVTFAPKTQGT